MSVEELKFAEWQYRLQELLLESDREELTVKMHNMEKLLAKRLQELDRGNDGHIERVAIGDALGMMRSIQRDKLGYPAWK